MQVLKPFSISIGTGDQANLAYGLPLFPALGAARAGISSTSRSNTIFDLEVTILFSRTKFHSYYLFLMGVLGPAIAFDLPGEVELTNLNANTGQVAVTFGQNQQIVAGLLIGLWGGAGFSLTQDLYLPASWKSPWRFSWQTAFNISYEFIADIITLLLKLIQKLVGAGVSKGIISPATGSKLSDYITIGQRVAGSFAFFDINRSGFGPNRTVRVEPSVTIPIDLVTKILGLGEFVKQLSRIVGELQFGPQFTVLMPVNLTLEDFTLTGAQGDNSSAPYGPIRYSGSTAVATGGPAFKKDPTKFSTGVSYTTGFEVALSFFFKIKICKLYSHQWASGSLNLLQLLNLPNTGAPRLGTVTTDVESGCVLIPQMSMIFVSLGTDPFYGAADLNSAIAGIPVQAKISLAGSWQGSPTTISLKTSPDSSNIGFPSSVPLARGDSFVLVPPFTLPNQLIVSGDPNKPEIPATAYSPDLGYLVTAKVNGTDPNQPCADLEVTVPLKVQNRYIVLEVDAATSSQGPVPPYPVNTPELLKAGAQINADPKRPKTDVSNFARVFYWFPFPPGAPPVGNVALDLSVLNELRQPVGANLKITFDSGASAVLTSPVSLQVPMGTQAAKRSFTLQWTKASTNTPNFSTLFILIINGKAAYGQAEFWINAWNWA